MILSNGRVYFTEEELRCPESGLCNLAIGFADELLILRLALNKPMNVNSCCRSTKHNKDEGGAKDSFHICDTGRGCCAIDIATPTPYYRTRLVELALQKGWSVGVGKTFVHLDRRSDYGYGPKVIFSY